MLGCCLIHSYSTDILSPAINGLSGTIPSESSALTKLSESHWCSVVSTILLSLCHSPLFQINCLCVTITVWQENTRAQTSLLIVEFPAASKPMMTLVTLSERVPQQQIESTTSLFCNAYVVLCYNMNSELSTHYVNGKIRHYSGWARQAELLMPGSKF
jgi:hypothetical protein